MKSCIYEGQVSHTRTMPVRHHFKYRLFMLYVDLDELPNLFTKRWFWSVSRPALARFRREKHLGSGDLQSAVRDRVESELGFRPSGPIRLLTNFSYFGYGFNPVSFYYCFDANDEAIQAVVVEVNNTPWGEQHTYVERVKDSSVTDSRWRFNVRKEMHVSPFMPMNVEYTWSLSAPSDMLSVFMANDVEGERTFRALLTLHHKNITSASLAGVLLRYPFQAARTMLAIHWQALRLWIKRVPIHAHPDKQTLAVENNENN
ncbi:MAG: DUF1365 domain-containing protein [Woeseiaceae bacterium]